MLIASISCQKIAEKKQISVFLKKQTIVKGRSIAFKKLKYFSWRTHMTWYNDGKFLPSAWKIMKSTC